MLRVAFGKIHWLLSEEELGRQETLGVAPVS